MLKKVINIKHLPVTPNKLEKRINFLKQSNFNYLFEINSNKNKIDLLIFKILKNIQNNLKKFKIIELFATRDKINKKIHARAKGRAFEVQKKYSNLNIILEEK